MAKKIFIPTKDANSWKPLVASKKHWKEGRSAMSIALSWEKRKDIPTEIKKVLSKNKKFKGIELLAAFPEYSVSLKGRGGSSQNDVFAVFTNPNGLSVMTVEGKANEGFDKTVAKWKTDEYDENENKNRRLDYILRMIGLEDNNIDNLRYQLFHRLASAVIMAEKYHAKNSIMIIQSFNDNDSENKFSDFADFLQLYGIEKAEKNKLYSLTSINEIELLAGWVYTDL